MKESVHDYDVFADDLVQEEDDHAHAAVGLWGITLLHVMKVAFVIYSGAHNIQAAIIATGDNTFALIAQIVGVLGQTLRITGQLSRRRQNGLGKLATLWQQRLFAR